MVIAKERGCRMTKRLCDRCARRKSEDVFVGSVEHYDGPDRQQMIRSPSRQHDPRLCPTQQDPTTTRFSSAKSPAKALKSFGSGSVAFRGREIETARFAVQVREGFMHNTPNASRDYIRASNDLLHLFIPFLRR